MSVVIIPAYKPDETLVTITDQLWAYGCQIVVADDGSGEEYQKIFDKVKDICIALHHSENRGKGVAIKTALTYIKNELWDSGLVGIMDCDGQHLPEDMMKLLEFAGAHRKALALGVRTAGAEMPLKSKLGNKITRMIFGIVSGVKVSDTQTGLRAFDAEMIPELLSVEGERYEYEMNVLMTLAKKKIPIVEVPIRTIYRDENNSNSHFRSFVDSVRIYKDILKFTFSSFASFLLDYALFSLMMFFMPHTAVFTLLANMVARAVSAFYNYSMNCRFVFCTKRKAKTAAHYFALAGFLLIMNNLILGMFTQVFHLSVYPAKLLTEYILFLFSWLVQKFVIFRKEKNSEARVFADREVKACLLGDTAMRIITGKKVKV